MEEAFEIIACQIVRSREFALCVSVIRTALSLSSPTTAMMRLEMNRPIA